MLISSYIAIFLLGLVVDSLVSKYFYDMIREIERTNQEDITRIRLDECKLTHQNELAYVQAMYQTNIANLKTKYGI